MEKIEKTIILHDYLMHRGGGERLILTLAEAFDAPLVTGFINPNSFKGEDFGVETISLGKPISYPGFRYLGIQYRFRHKTDFLKNYDIAIFSANCIAAARNCRKDTLKIFYCHTPIRNAYDLYEFHLSRMPWWKKVPYIIFCKFIRFNYKRDLRFIDVVVVNSKNVQDRVKRYLHRDSVIVYPPIDTEKFKWISQGDYYLSYARVDLVKRVVDIARAFLEMPDKKLIIASTGTEVEKLQELISRAPNITYVGCVTDDELRKLVGNCIATIYIPKDEDFGMSPLESMSAGKPCIGVAEGGLLETISDGIDGVLIPKNPSTKDIIDGVKKLSPEMCLKMRNACVDKAQKFSIEVFVNAMKKIINETYSH